MPVVPRLLRAVFLGATAVAVLAPAAAANATPSPSDLQAQINQSSSALEKIVEQYNGIGEQLKATQAAADQLNAQMAPMQAKVDAAYANVGKIAAQAYKGGNPSSPMALLLSDGTPNNFLGNLASLNRIASAQQKEIQGYAQTKAQYDAEKKRLDNLLAQQTADQKNLGAQKTKIEGDLAQLMALRKQAYGTATAAKPAAVAAPNIAGSAGAAVRYAYGAIGKPYVYATSGPNSYDCSGLTAAAWEAAGKSLPHNAAMQWNVVAHITRSQLQAGDLVFYSGLGHVAIYVGGNQVIHAPQPGEYVKLASVDMMTPYGYGRVR